MKTKKVLSMLLALAIIISSFATVTITASAETTKKTMNMGGSVISASAEKAKDRDIIYYGDQTKWRVLSTKGNTLDSDGDMVKFNEGAVTKENALFVISENDFGERAFDYEGLKPIVMPWGETQWVPYGSKIWQGSDAQKWCNEGEFYTAAGITDMEKAAILTTLKVDIPCLINSQYNSCSINDKVFYISANEANTYFNNKEDRKFALGGEAALWWLRSPSAYNDADDDIDDDVGNVNFDGDISHIFADVDNVASRPAFNLNLSSVLFTSAAKGGKVAGAIGNYSENEWKLTLKDSDRDSFTASCTSKDGNRIQISYSGAKTGTNENVSYIITDSTGNNIKYYESRESEGSGSFEITLPDISRTDRIFVFNEQANEDYITDYASELKEIEIFDSIKLTVNVNDAAMGTVTVSPEKPVPEENVTLNAIANSGYRFVRFTSNDVKISTDGTTGTFVAPNNDVTVTANFEAVSQTEHTVTVVSNYPRMGSASASVATAKTGDVVTLSNEPADGNTFVEYISGDVNIEGNAFRMLDKDVTVIAMFKADATFSNNTSTPIQAKKYDNGTALLRFMWGLEKADGAYLGNVGAYIIPWDIFEAGSKANPGIVLVTKPNMVSGDTFSADYANVPSDYYETSYCAIPFINGMFFGNAIIKGTVNDADVDKVIEE